MKVYRIPIKSSTDYEEAGNFISPDNAVFKDFSCHYSDENGKDRAINADGLNGKNYFFKNVHEGTENIFFHIVLSPF